MSEGKSQSSGAQVDISPVGRSLGNMLAAAHRKSSRGTNEKLN